MVSLCYNHLIIITDDLLCGQSNELPPKVTNDLDFHSWYLESTKVFDFNKTYLHIVAPNICACIFIKQIYSRIWYSN